MVFNVVLEIFAKLKLQLKKLQFINFISAKFELEKSQLEKVQSSYSPFDKAFIE
jgi:hypothetical protein